MRKIENKPLPENLIEMGEMQKGIYFDCLLNNNAEYNISATVKTEEIDASILQLALDIVVANQSSLRMTVVESMNSVFFKVQDSMSAEVEVLEVASDWDVDWTLSRWMETRYDLSNGPLFRVACIHMSNRETLVSLGLHHLIGDGISINIFLKDLFSIYDSLLKGNEVDVEANNGYIDALTEQRMSLEKGEYESQRNYWQEKLKGAVIPEYATDFANDLHSENRSLSYTLAIDKKLFSSMKEVAKGLNISPFMFSTGIFSLLLGKICTTDDICFSTAFTYRPEIMQEESIGCFIHNLPLRFKLDPSKKIKELMVDSKTEIIESYFNIGYPANRIVRDSDLINDQGESILDISFIYDAYEVEDRFTVYKSSTTTFPGKMMVLLEDINGEASINFQYREKEFTRESVERLAKRYIYLLEQVVENVERDLDSLDYLPEEEKKTLKDWNDSEFFKYTPTTILPYFEKKVREHPDEHSLFWKDGSISNKELDIISNQVANTLLEKGVKSQDCIGVQLKRSPRLITSILGVIKAGCAYVPIDVDYPLERKEFMIEDAGISYVLTEDKLSCGNAELIYVDRISELSQNTEVPKVKVDPRDLCYVEYTSGSTGRPKGVMIEHWTIVNTALDLDRRFPLNKEDIYLLKTTFTFDIFGTEFFGWLVNDGRLYLLEDGGEKDPECILNAISEAKITHINFVPSLFHIFLDYLETYTGDLSSLKWIFIGGEAVTPDIIERYFKVDCPATMENVYGPTEATMWATHYPIREKIQTVNTPIGRPLNLYKLYILDEKKQPQPIGVPGELYIAGPCLARGYRNLPEKTAEVFVENVFYDPKRDPEYLKTMYNTGDLARWLNDGNLEFLGRKDFQVQINGMRVELSEVEVALNEIEGIQRSVVTMEKNKDNISLVCGFYTGNELLDEKDLREQLEEKLPNFMIPSVFIHLEEIPLLGNGKVNRKALSAIFEKKQISLANTNSTEDFTYYEETLKELWSEILAVNIVDKDRSFFDVGGHSISLISLQSKIKLKYDVKISITDLMNSPTIEGMAKLLEKEKGILEEAIMGETVKASSKKPEKNDIAIVGIGLDIPGANEVHEFWNNLVEGKESICHYTDEELIEFGIPEEEVKSPNYIASHGALDHLDYFDHKFFEMTPAEVRQCSPQLRVLYETTWKAIEDAGYPLGDKNNIGVYIGGSDDFNWYQSKLFSNANYSDIYQRFTMSTNHFLSTRLSHFFDLKGPSISALTGCSTSLLTVHLACKAIQNGECDGAIAGGITIESPNHTGYDYVPGMMFSPDGHVRPFDEKAEGTVFSNGCGVVFLKSLEKAIADQDHIYAVIKGSAANNDGKKKLSFTAPSEDGQVDVMEKAYNSANIDPETISFIEAHGTGTFLGDPIEVASLTRAFDTNKKQFCELGSVKGNIGHTDTAAGVIGLIKTALALDKKYLPGTVNFETPNPNIDFEGTPFYVSNKGKKWINRGVTPRRAGINSFGVGGTNVHMILEECAEVSKPTKEANYELLTFSAKTEEAVDNTAEKIIDYIYHSNENLGSVSHTLAKRQEFSYRKSIVLPRSFREEPLAHWMEVLEDISVEKSLGTDKIAFMFSGQGTQYQGMAKEIYYSRNYKFSRIFRRTMDEVFSYLSEEEEEIYREVLFGESEREKINQTLYSQFCIFALEYAMAKTYMSLGLKPSVLIGHSIGEVTAAALANVWTLEDAVRVVIRRSQLMQSQERGAMIAISATAEEIKPYLIDNTWISLKNTTERIVIGGTFDGINRLKASLDKEEIEYKDVKTSHAFHTPMMEEAAKSFEHFLRTIPMSPPEIPILSNVEGGYVDEELFCTPSYWSRHIMKTVEFERELEKLLEDPILCIELGPGRTLSTFGRLHKDRNNKHKFIQSVRHPRKKIDDIEFLLGQLGRIWSLGCDIKKDKLFDRRGSQKVHLPGYVFDQHHYPIVLELPTRQDTSTVGQGVEELEQIVIEDEDQAVEEMIACFKEVFGYDTIDKNEDFFELGGDSLKAASLSGVINSRLGLNISVQEIFDLTTPKKLAKKVDIGSRSIDRIRPTKEMDSYPLSSAQQRMYAFYQMDQETLAYNLPSATLIEGHLDEELVKKSFDKLLDIHEALRTCFRIENNEIRQFIKQDISLPILFTEGICKDEEDFDRLFTDFVRPFSLEEGPLFRVEVVDIGDNRSILLFDIHHIIADATAVEIISGDFNKLYFGEELEKGIQYKDYAVWEQAQLDSEESLAQRAYWLDQLVGELPTLNMPTDFQRPEIMDLSGARYSFPIDANLTETINKFSRHEDGTNFMTVLGGWFAFLSRYTEDEDIIVGTPVAGRTRSEIQDTVGMFVNMLPIRSYPNKNKSFKEYYQEIKTEVLGALSNQDYQFDRLVEDLDIERKLNRNAVFDVSFDYHNIDLQALDIQGLKFKELDTPIKSASIDMLLTINEDNEGALEGFIDYSTALFKSTTIESLAERFLSFLSFVLENPLEEIGEAPILISSDYEFYENQKLRNQLCYDTSKTILDSFKETLDKYGEAEAVITSTEPAWTFNDLDQKSNGIASILKEKDIALGDSVGIMAKRVPELFASMLAIHKVGANYIAIDPSYPVERIKYMVENSNMEILLVMDDESLDFNFEYEVVNVQRIKAKKSFEGPYIAPDEICYTSFTSGSTGNPKGVQVKHRGIYNLLKDHERREIFKAGDGTMLCIASPSFDIFGVESMLPLSMGNSVFLANEEEMLDSSKLANYIQEHNITHIQAPISRLRAMVENPSFKPVLKQLRFIIGGGEHYPLSLLNYLQANSEAVLYNMYGPTETTVTATMADLTYAQQIDIGKPLYNVEIYIVDDQGHLMPKNTYGEICIGGAGLSKGYLNNPEETKKSFGYLQDLPDTLVYKTGDQGRILDNGSIELVGRIDNQVKLRGYRIELGEIEKTCLDLQEIENAVVKLFKGGVPQLALFYIPDEEYREEKNLNDIVMRHLESYLPNYMIPDACIQMETFPLLPNGKINRSVLTLDLKLEQSIEESHEPVISSAKLGPVEKQVMEIWKDVLEIDSLTTADNFFDIGGNSFSLMLVNNQLNSVFNQEIPLMKLFEYPTVQALTNYLVNDETIQVSNKVFEEESVSSQDIAVIGMDGRFPGANSVQELWDNLLKGEESIFSFSEDELIHSGVSKEEYNSEDYVNAKGYLADTEYFDYEFFGYTKREASQMDPQIRLFHQCVYHALEDAGYDSIRYSGRIALFGGSSSNLPWMVNLIDRDSNPINMFELMTLNDKDFLTTKVSYKLNLQGPSVNVQTACSTSLVAIHQATQQLLARDCDMAVAGGVSITYPQKEGYLWQEGMIFSQDGHCRPFSANATGTVSGNGTGAVVLKRLEDAQRDGDHIYAVIKGSAVNNDGIDKIGFTAPSINGEREVIEKALSRSKIKAEDIQYVEAHGTGTILGDPIEIQGLSQAWKTSKKNYCAIGSIKANIGHLDAAAGVAGFIKAVLILHNRQIPKMINFTEPNPQLNLEDSPFYINTNNVNLEDSIGRVAVSAFGIGGTNAHIILEEAPKA